MPGLVVGAVGSHVGEAEVGSGTLPRVASLTATLGDITVDLDGTVLIVGTTTRILDDLTADLDGTVLVQALLTRDLDALGVDLDGAVLVQVVVARTLDGIGIDADGTVSGTEIIGTLAATLAGIGADLDGTILVTGTFTRTLDGIGLVAQGTVAASGPISGLAIILLDGIELDAAAFVLTITSIPGEHREWHSTKRRRPTEARRHPWGVNALDRTGRPARTPWRGSDYRDRWLDS
jgi:hypothetical protein